MRKRTLWIVLVAGVALLWPYQSQTWAQGKDSSSNKKSKRKGDMVAVPAGAAFMGCNEEVDKECDDDEKPGGDVTVEAFSIDKTEVTVRQFARCVKAGQCSSQGLTMPYEVSVEQPEFAWACNWNKRGRGNHPINCLDWFQAQAYCTWAGKRLPTEVEWEKAARGMDKRTYPWGNQGYENTGQIANIADETAKQSQPNWTIADGYNDGFYGTAPVGTFPANASPYGAVDMVGNVWEWTADWYDKEQPHRSIRGGSWSNPSRDARTPSRGGNVPEGRYEDVGVRCVR